MSVLPEDDLTTQLITTTTTSSKPFSGRDTHCESISIECESTQITGIYPQIISIYLSVCVSYALKLYQTSQQAQPNIQYSKVHF